MYVFSNERRENVSPSGYKYFTEFLKAEFIANVRVKFPMTFFHNSNLSKFFASKALHAIKFFVTAMVLKFKSYPKNKVSFVCQFYKMSFAFP